MVLNDAAPTRTDFLHPSFFIHNSYIMNLNSHDVVVFTDGSSRGNPGPGGFGAIIIAPKIHDSGFMIQELGGREERTTNNRMELTAAIKALQQIQDSRPNAAGGQARFKIQVFSDSSYLVNGITKWVHGWQQNGWKTKEKKDVENRDLWEKLVDTSRNKDVQWKQVGGHAGVPGNMRSDEIATAFADGKPVQLYSGVLQSYGIPGILEIPHGPPRTDLSPDSRSVLGSREARARSRTKAYSYVSLVDGKVETHKTWAECEKKVKGKTAKYKKTLSAEEEKALIAEWSKL